ncbi:MAG: hypothetical protein HY718_16805 [Planctomycetes bacterium]|nr:hypothetical protein [Planctomycetota bacterium]
MKVLDDTLLAAMTRRLVDEFDPQFGDWRTAGQMLTPYATIYRYPGETAEPDPD